MRSHAHGANREKQKIGTERIMISNLAYVHPDAKLGANVVVEPFACISGDVVIGDDCWIALRPSFTTARASAKAAAYTPARR